MSIIYIDIETLPYQGNDLKSIIKHPGNISKQETIEKWYLENSDTGSEAHRKTSFDGLYGQIFSIAWAMNDEDTRVVSTASQTEKSMLKSFFSELSKHTDKHGQRAEISLWVGHYITGFDLRFIWQRCVVNGIRPSVNIPYDARPWDSKVFDTKVAWTGASQYSGAGSLDALSKAFGMEGKGDIDGSKVYDYWLAGKYKEIEHYNMQDVIKTRELYKKMHFIWG